MSTFRILDLSKAQRRKDLPEKLILYTRHTKTGKQVQVQQHVHVKPEEAPAPKVHPPTFDWDTTKLWRDNLQAFIGQQAKKIFGVEFFSAKTALIADNSMEPDVAGYRAWLDGRIGFRSCYHNAIRDVCSLKARNAYAKLTAKREKKPYAEPEPIDLHARGRRYMVFAMKALLHENLHGAGQWKQPINTAKDDKEREARANLSQYYREEHGRVLQEGAVESLASMEAPAFWAGLGVKMGPDLKYDDKGEAMRLHVYVDEVRMVEMLVNLACGDTEGIRLDQPKQKRVLRDLCFGWKQTDRPHELALLISASLGPKESKKARKERVALVEQAVKDAAGAMLNSTDVAKKTVLAAAKTPIKKARKALEDAAKDKQAKMHVAGQKAALDFLTKLWDGLGSQDEDRDDKIAAAADLLTRACDFDLSKQRDKLYSPLYKHFHAAILNRIDRGSLMGPALAEIMGYTDLSPVTPEIVAQWTADEEAIHQRWMDEQSKAAADAAKKRKAKEKPEDKKEEA